MVSLSSSREHQTFSFFVCARAVSSTPVSSSSTPSSSPNSCMPNIFIPQKRSYCLPFVIAERSPLAESSIVPDHRLLFMHHWDTSSISEFGFKTLHSQTFNPENQIELETDVCQKQDVKEVSKPDQQQKKGMKHGSMGFHLKIGNASLKRLISGAFAGAVSRTAVAPLETIRTHLMVGSGGQTVGDVFCHIMENEGWQGLFRGNGINVIRVAPSKAIELFSYDTMKKVLDKTPWVPSHIPFPTSSIAGAAAGVCSTLCTYPLELLKTRLTIQRGVYVNMFDAFLKICKEEGPRELYRGLTPSLIGVVPYSATNYFAYDFLRKLYKQVMKCEHVGHLPTLLIGSAAGAFASAATFPLEVARKQMQVGALSGRPVYHNVLHVLASVLEQQGPAGLYRGLGASCIKLIPAAGISFMCYEACKHLLIEEDA